MGKKPETKFKEIVLADLRKLPNCWCEKIQQRSIHGTLDIIACIYGKYVTLELKSSKKAKIDALQLRTLAKVKDAKGIALAIEPEEWPRIYDALKKLSMGLMPTPLF